MTDGGGEGGGRLTWLVLVVAACKIFWSSLVCGLNFKKRDRDRERERERERARERTTQSDRESDRKKECVGVYM